MNLRIRADYPATDGSMPESVEVEWTEVGLLGDSDLVQVVLGMLLRAPSTRGSLPIPVHMSGDGTWRRVE